MLSLIICSRTPRISEELEKNISETIGCEYELVLIDNSKNKYSIFSAYNEGVRRAKGNNLCFMHDDIWYKTLNWGMQVEKKLEDESIGIVGVIGSYVMTKDCGYWDMMAPWVTGRVPIESRSGWKGVNDCDYFYGKNSIDEVAMIDGFWFCMSSKVFQKVSFDETYNGFHFYDMDICMQLLVNGYRNTIIHGIEIIHMCSPTYNYQFSIAMSKFHQKWMTKLPVFCGEAIGISEQNYKLLYENNCRYCWLLDKYNFYRYDVENSVAYKLGNAIAYPYRKFIKLFKKK